MRERENLAGRAAVWLPLIAVLVACAMIARGGLHAQDENEPAAAASAPAAQPTDDETPADEEKSASRQAADSLGVLVVKSGYVGIAFYVVLFVFSLVTLTIALERVINLRRSKVVPPKFVKELRDLLLREEGSAENFRRLCEGPESAVSRVLRAGLLRAGRPLVEVEKAMEDAAAREMSELRARNRPLAVLGNVAPLVGLQGTVVGMIFAFGTASKVGLGQGERLAEGIYLALMTTAGGLSIAIPALLVVAFLNARAERYMREIDECLMETMPTFGRLEQGRQTAAANADAFGKTLADFPLSVGEDD